MRYCAESFWRMVPRASCVALGAARFRMPASSTPASISRNLFPGIPISRARAGARLDSATIRHTRESAPPINTPMLECWTPLARNDERARINRRHFQSERRFAVRRFSFATLSRQEVHLDRAERHAPCLTPGRQSGSGSTRGDATAPGAQARADGRKVGRERLPRAQSLSRSASLAGPDRNPSPAAHPIGGTGNVLARTHKLT
jgi:hypothetical protein